MQAGVDKEGGPWRMHYLYLQEEQPDELYFGFSLHLFFPVTSHFVEEGRIPSEPVAHALPFSRIAHMITMLLIRSVIFITMWIPIMKVMVERIAAQPCELLPRREEVPPHSVHGNL